MNVQRKIPHLYIKKKRFTCLLVKIIKLWLQNVIRDVYAINYSILKLTGFINIFNMNADCYLKSILNVKNIISLLHIKYN